ncbi:MAG: hypothetical protein L6R35_005242 [Caloplaca aegaea]|nr:MAG: hypothetical protein L6R35_005242 [Caloplaca aegaea]
MPLTHLSLIPPVAAGELEGPPEPDGAPTTPSDSSQPLILCAPSTETYIKLTIKPTNVNHALGGNDQEIAEDLGGLIGNSWTYITRQYLIAGKNGVINKGEGIIWQKISTHGHFILQVANAHHWKPVPKWGGHGTMKIVGNEVTWAVLRAGLTALGTHFQETNVWSECSFEIWDGFNQVGTAMVRGCYESCE